MTIKRDQPIVIGGWDKGIGKSPLSGFADMRNVEIHDPAGVLKIALAPTKISSTTVTQLPTWMAKDYAAQSDFYFGGYLDGSNVYSLSSGSVATLGSTSVVDGTCGGFVWKGYVFVLDYNGAGSETLDVYKISNGTWTNSLKTFSGPNFSNARTTPFIWGQDDILYIGVGRYVASLQEITTFDPSNASTYTWTEQALDLPEGYHIESLAELGKYLTIGASRYFGAVTQETYEGRVFFWDRTSSSFNIPTILDRGGVRQMISRNGELVFSNGTKGNFLSTNGSFTRDIDPIGLLQNLPSTANGLIYPEAKAFVNGEYLFGISTENTSFVPAGIYGYKNKAWRFLSISTDSVGDTNALRIGVVYKKDDTNFYVGWADNTTYGIDEFGYSNYRYTGYRARVDSELYQIGTPKQKRQLQTLEFTLAKPLASNQGIRISARTNLSDSFTTVGTYDHTTLGAVTNHHAKALVPAADQVQFRVELTTGSNSTITPELKQVVIY